MFGLGWPELALIGVAAVLVFGPKKLPELGSALGKSLRGFKEGINQTSEEIDEQTQDKTETKE